LQITLSSSFSIPRSFIRATVRFRGGDPTVADGLHAAVARLPQIIGWALVSATVGVILKAIESRSEKVGQFVAGLLGAGWSIATYFVVPVLVVEKVGLIAAIERSFAILRKTWGESLTAQFSIGLAVMLASLLAMVPAVLGFLLGNMATIIVGITISVLLIILSLAGVGRSPYDRRRGLVPERGRGQGARAI
jgi:hypothetical protein